MRNFGVEAAEAIARRHAEDRHPYVVGFNLVGDEAAWPASLFARAYEIAAGSGLGCTVHAGEHDGPESVRAALELPITRMSHGVRAIEEPALVAELAERGIVLEVCPSSNVAARRRSRATRTIRSVRSGRPGCGSRSALTTRPISDVVSAQSTPWRASTSASRRNS